MVGWLVGLPQGLGKIRDDSLRVVGHIAQRRWGNKLL